MHGLTDCEATALDMRRSVVTCARSAGDGPRVFVERGSRAFERLAECERFFDGLKDRPLSAHPRWLKIAHEGLGHDPWLLVAEENGDVQGILAIADVRSLLFGRFLVSLPYVNYGGVLTRDAATAGPLIDAAVALAERLNVRYLQLRHDRAVDHPRLITREDLKVHMRLDLPPGVDALWKGLTPSVRNQVRKGQKGEFTVGWGAHALLDEFYDVFSINMRDLGTPVFGRRLFRVILEQFPGAAELCVVRDGRRAVAGALLLHGSGITEVPSASTLRTYNKSCANMLLYWHLLARAVERGQEAFDFGRSSPESGSHHFKKQWGARASNACWQFLVRRGEIASVQRENPRFVYLIRLWKRLPMRLSQTLGPLLARSIP